MKYSIFLKTLTYNLRICVPYHTVASHLVERIAHQAEVPVELLKVVGYLVRIFLENAVGNKHLEILGLHRKDILKSCLAG